MKKWIFYVGIGDLPPKEGFAYVENVKAQVLGMKFFPENRVLFIPRRGSDSRVEPIEVD